ncbi:MAG: hypothetical protein E7365_04670 [Clostridiales bacterium]|nr:hypothetical protein [Clostridiales bacterium]
MISWIKEYILTIVVISVIGLILECLLNEGNIKKYAMFGVSIILCVNMIQPFLKINFEINKPDINNKYHYTIDYNDAVSSTVNSVKGFENAKVNVDSQNNKIIKITINPNADKLIEKTISNTTKEYIKTLLNAIYGVDKENIFFTE